MRIQLRVMITVLAAVVGVGLLSISCLGQTDLDALMQGFLSGNFAESSKAQDALVELGDTAVPKMAEILQRNRDQWNRVKAVNVLGRIGTANAIEVLVTGIADSDSIVRDSTAGAIKKLDQSGKVIATRHLASYLVHNQLTARSAAGKLLEELGVGKADIAPGLAGVIAAGQGQQRNWPYGNLPSSVERQAVSLGISYLW